MILITKMKLVKKPMLAYFMDGTTSTNALVEKRIRYYKKITKDNNDVLYKNIPTNEGIVTIIFSQSLTDSKTLEIMVLIPLANYIHQIHQVAEYMNPSNIDEITKKLAIGETLLYFHETNQLLSIHTYSVKEREVTTSEMESTFIGPQDVFTESIQTNLSLVKRRIVNPMLKNEDLTIGSVSNTKITIIYIDDLVDKTSLEQLKSRLTKLDYPKFFDISTLMQLIEDNPYSLFPQYYMTVKPDTTSHYLADGRIVILMDNSQAALVCPTSFLEMFISAEDYYNRWPSASLVRSLRFFGFFLTIMITPTYISALTFHQEVLPYELLLNLQESRMKVPFSPLFEVLFIELIVEVLKEAGARMPAKIGQTIGIVGGIVIGTAAVEAGLVSNILIVIVATSALLSFLPPVFHMSNTSRTIRYVFILSAGIFGLFGQMLAFAWLIAHLLRVKSLGTPFMSPVIPRRVSDLMDSVVRFPISFLKRKSGISRSKKRSI